MLLCVAEKNPFGQKALVRAGLRWNPFFRGFRKRWAGQTRILFLGPLKSARQAKDGSFFCLVLKELCRLKPASFAPRLLENFLRTPCARVDPFCREQKKDSDASGIHKTTKNTPAFGTRVPERTFCVLRCERAKFGGNPISGNLHVKSVHHI